MKHHQTAMNFVKFFSTLMFLGLLTDAAPVQAAASANGATITGAGALYDYGGNTWTLSRGVVYENGQKAGYSANVVELAFVNGRIYQENSAGGWWDWVNHTWVAAKSPFTSGTNGACGAANGTTVSAAPTANLCSTGTASVVSGAGPWTWNCAGTNGGTTASCSAQKKTGTTTGVWSAANFANSGVRGFNQPSDTSAASMAAAKAYGSKVNVIRFFIDDQTGGLSNNGSQYRIGSGGYGTFNFTALDAVLANMQSAGIKMIPVIDDGKVLFNNPSLQNSFVAMWQAFATHYRGNAGIAAFDLWNEPISGGATQDQWIALSQRTASAIRAIDPDHVIIWEPLPWGNPYSYDNMTAMPLAAFTNIVYSFHEYEPHLFTGQGAGGQGPYGVTYPNTRLSCYPNPGPGNPLLDWNATTLGPNSLNCDGSGRQTILDLQAQFHFPVFVGEFSAYTAAPINSQGNPSATQWVNDMIVWMESKGFSWTYHDWNNWWGWDPDIDQSVALQLNNDGGTAPYPPPRDTNSPTSQVLKKHF
jgi:cellulase (glycosyl hydrolase family 5)